MTASVAGDRSALVEYGAVLGHESPGPGINVHTLGIILLLVVIYLGTRRQRAAWRNRR